MKEGQNRALFHNNQNQSMSYSIDGADGSVDTEAPPKAGILMYFIP